MASTISAYHATPIKYQDGEVYDLNYKAGMPPFDRMLKAFFNV